jgi:hypothetical protein
MKEIYLYNFDVVCFASTGKIGKPIRHDEAIIEYMDRSFGELKVFLSPADASERSTSKSAFKGYSLYEDQTWLKSFREQLVTKIGFSPAAAADVSFSEDGMQGDDYVSLDVGATFMKEAFLKYM